MTSGLVKIVRATIATKGRYKPRCGFAWSEDIAANFAPPKYAVRQIRAFCKGCLAFVRLGRLTRFAKYPFGLKARRIQTFEALSPTPKSGTKLGTRNLSCGEKLAYSAPSNRRQSSGSRDRRQGVDDPAVGHDPTFARLDHRRELSVKRFQVGRAIWSRPIDEAWPPYSGSRSASSAV
jgi:hypothetical protein